MTDQPPKSSDAADTPEGHTAEQPAVSEIGEPGTPGAGRTLAEPHAADAELVEAGEAPADPVAHHGASHMDVHTTISDDDHGHAEESLGPIDWRAWGLAILGGAAGVLVLACFALVVGI
ncbi:MAG TPA: hypothetical protein VM284_06080 [Candidatus Limnocylindria bacterium]|nr:hypothetical protein [Candidatus Limnocylindria bacterium]